MSLLQLSPFTKSGNAINLNSYNTYESNLKPEINEEVFIFHKIGENKPGEKPGKYTESADKVNFSIVRKALGYSAKDKFDKMTVQLVKNNSKNQLLGAQFISNRASELSNMYDELVDIFLTYLHKSVWSVYDVTAKKYVLSTINYQDAYEDLKLGILLFEVILTKIIDDKYNSKYAEIETENATKQKDLDLNMRVGVIKNKK